jgi:hypothetical protein
VAVFPIAEYIYRNDLLGGLGGMVEGGVVGEAEIAAEPVEGGAGHEKGKGGWQDTVSIRQKEPLKLAASAMRFLMNLSLQRRY